jgi:hypothetical protein
MMNRTDAVHAETLNAFEMTNRVAACEIPAIREGHRAFVGVYPPDPVHHIDKWRVRRFELPRHLLEKTFSEPDLVGSQFLRVDTIEEVEDILCSWGIASSLFDAPSVERASVSVHESREEPAQGSGVGRQRAVGLREAAGEGPFPLASGAGRVLRDDAMLVNGLDLAGARPRKNWPRRLPAEGPCLTRAAEPPADQFGTLALPAHSQRESRRSGGRHRPAPGFADHWAGFRREAI